MAIEQIELSLSNVELFNKYLHFLKIETPNIPDSNMLHLRGGFYDQSKRYIFKFKIIIGLLFRILELNTCGVSNFLKLVFLDNLENRPWKNGSSSRTGGTSSAYPSSSQNVSDRIKNEIIPLLH